MSLKDEIDNLIKDNQSKLKELYIERGEFLNVRNEVVSQIQN